MYVLGIDGGGTRTSGVVADETGKVYMQAFGEGSNPTTMAREIFEEVITMLLNQLEQQDPAIFSQLEVCFAGMAGVMESGLEEEFEALLVKQLPAQTKIMVKNDAYNALYSGTLGNPGIVQIAGTGSITFGVNYDEETARCGGWGYLFDEAGSAFYLGNKALRAIFKYHDGSGPATVMTGRILEHFGITRVEELTAKIYGPEQPRQMIAQLCPIVIDAAESGDAVAKGIICEACENMMQCMETCHRQLFVADHPTVIVLAGGVFTKPQQFLWYLNELSKKSLPNVVFRETRFAPIGGAIVGGLKAMGINSISETFKEQMSGQLKE